jgi:YVTN family beta-propeller protein
VAEHVPTVYVTNQNANDVSVSSTASNTVTAVIPVGAGPYGVAATVVP